VTVVLDTSVLIDVLRGDEAALGYVRNLSEVPVCSEVTRIEVARGLRRSERRSAEQLFAALTWVPVDEPIARRTGELGRRWDRHRPGIALADLVIAATAEHVEAALATANAKHFPMFEDIRSPY
jgi:predicted nucleic acid-binding protein